MHRVKVRIAHLRPAQDLTTYNMSWVFSWHWQNIFETDSVISKVILITNRIRLNINDLASDNRTV